MTYCLRKGGEWRGADGELYLERLEGDPRGENYSSLIDFADRSYAYLGWAIRDNSWLVPVVDGEGLILGKYMRTGDHSLGAGENMKGSKRPTTMISAIVHRVQHGD